MREGVKMATCILYGLMLIVGLALCIAVALKYERGTLTARWLLSLPVYTLCMGAMAYLL